MMAGRVWRRMFNRESYKLKEEKAMCQDSVAPACCGRAAMEAVVQSALCG